MLGSISSYGSLAKLLFLKKQNKINVVNTSQWLLSFELDEVCLVRGITSFPPEFLVSFPTTKASGQAVLSPADSIVIYRRESFFKKGRV